MGGRIKKACRNCGRIAEIQSDGLCGRCYYNVWKKNLKKGTPEYDAALAEAKIKYTDPNYRLISPEQIQAEKTNNVKTNAVKFRSQLIKKTAVIRKCPG